MKLLLDHNLSPRLVEDLADIYPESIHVHQRGLDREPDLALWRFARDRGYVIVTQDADFSELSAVFGFPPLVIWIRRGNCSTRQIESILRLNRDAATRLIEDPNSGVLVLF